MRASFRRIPTLGNAIKIEHRDGNVTTFGSEAAYEIFKVGLTHTSHTLYDEIQSRYVVGSAITERRMEKLEKLG